MGMSQGQHHAIIGERRGVFNTIVKAYPANQNNQNTDPIHFHLRKVSSCLVAELYSSLYCEAPLFYDPDNSLARFLKGVRYSRAQAESFTLWALALFFSSVSFVLRCQQCPFRLISVSLQFVSYLFFRLILTSQRRSSPFHLGVYFVSTSHKWASKDEAVRT